METKELKIIWRLMGVWGLLIIKLYYRIISEFYFDQRFKELLYPFI